MANTSSGMDERLQSMLGYLIPIILPIIWLTMERNNRFVRVSAIQSLIFAGLFIVLQMVLGILGMVFSIVFLGFLISAIDWAVRFGFLIIWILMMVRAMQGEIFKLPVITDISNQLG